MKVLPASSSVPLIKYVYCFYGVVLLNANLLPRRNRVLTGSLDHAAVLGLNALLAECPEVLTEHFSVELPTVICQGIANQDVSRVSNPS